MKVMVPSGMVLLLMKLDAARLLPSLARAPVPAPMTWMPSIGSCFFPGPTRTECWSTPLTSLAATLSDLTNVIYLAGLTKASSGTNKRLCLYITLFIYTSSIT
jgi:hypothetical protein